MEGIPESLLFQFPELLKETNGVIHISRNKNANQTENRDLHTLTNRSARRITKKGCSNIRDDLNNYVKMLQTAY